MTPELRRSVSAIVGKWLIEDEASGRAVFVLQFDAPLGGRRGNSEDDLLS